MSETPSTKRSQVRRLRVRLRRALRPVYEVASFLGAGLTAVFQLLTGRLPTLGRKAAGARQPTEPPRSADRGIAPYPIEE